MSKVKLCGLRRIEDVEIVNRYLPDYVGFVFATSKRQVTLDEALRLKEGLDPSIGVVGVFVNEGIEQVMIYAKAKVMDRIQLHGDEDEAYIRKLKYESNLPLIKAIRVRDRGDIEMANQTLADYVLLDKYSDKAYGGLGETFNWDLLHDIKRPYFLAGGVGIENVEGALAYAPYCIDVSSKVETEGCKDERKIRALIKRVRETK